MFLRSFHKRTRIVGVLLAVALAFLAQYLFTGEIFTRFQESNTWDWKPEYFWALVCLAGTVLCSAWAFFPTRKTESDGVLPAKPLRLTGLGKRIWIYSSLGCAALSIGLYLALGENLAVDGLWLAGIGLFIVPLWLRSRGAAAQEPSTPWWEWAFVSGATLVGFGLRYWHLTEIPAHVDNDVALMGTFAQEIIRSSTYGWVGYSGSAHLLSYVQTLAWSMRLFGQDQYGLVMISVLFGTVTLPLVYLLGRELGGRQVGWIALGLITLSYTHIHFSRILFGTSSTLAATATFYFVFRGLRTHQPLWFVLAGLATSWGMLNYNSGRVVPIILVSLVVWQWIWQRKALYENFQNWMVLGAGILIGLGPMLGFICRDFNSFWGRGNVVMLWNPDIWEHEMASYEATSGFEVIWQQIWRTFLTLHLTNDSSPHFSYTRPMVAPLTAALYTIGAGGFLGNLKDLKWFLGLSWMVCTFISGGVLTADPPYWPHLNVALPGIALLAAMGGNELIKLISVMFRRFSAVLLPAAFGMAIVASGITNLTAYLQFAQENPGLRIGISRYLNTLPSGYQVDLFSPDFSWNEFAFRFFNQGIPGQDVTLEELVEQPSAISAPTVFVFYDQPDLQSTLQNLYPGGENLNHFNTSGDIVFTTYMLTPPGSTLVPRDRSINPLRMPGWWLIGLGLAAWLTWLIFLFQKQRRDRWKIGVNESRRV